MDREERKIYLGQTKHGMKRNFNWADRLGKEQCVKMAKIVAEEME
jgi:hypothetical protein